MSAIVEIVRILGEEEAFHLPRPSVVVVVALVASFRMLLHVPDIHVELAQELHRFARELVVSIEA